MKLEEIIRMALSGVPLFTPEGRQLLPNADNSVSTEQQVTFPHKGGWYNAPSIYQGKRGWTEDEILELLLRTGWIDPDTGRFVGQRYGNMDEAIRAAISHSGNINPTDYRTSAPHPSLGR